MSYVFVALAFFALLHFVYESILSPSIRLHLRFRLFALRDELRKLKITKINVLNDKHFDYLQDSINTLIANLFRFDAATVVQIARRTASDPEFRRRVEERARILDDCNIPEVREIRKNSLDIAALAFGINSVTGWLFYVVPVILIWAVFSKFRATIKSAISLSERDFARVAPQTIESGGIPA